MLWQSKNIKVRKQNFVDSKKSHLKTTKIPLKSKLLEFFYLICYSGNVCSKNFHLKTTKIPLKTTLNLAGRNFKLFPIRFRQDYRSKYLESSTWWIKDLINYLSNFIFWIWERDRCPFQKCKNFIQNVGSIWFYHTYYWRFKS